jgi:RNA-binding protein
MNAEPARILADKPSLTGSERKYLRGLAHHLKPLVQIGKTGLTPNVLAGIDEALEHHELIKVRFLDFKDQKRQLSQTIATDANSEIIGSIGHVFMFYRQHPDPEKRKIHLPSH